MDASDRPVLVTGASGFVGSHITRALVQRGRKVRVMLRATSSREALRGLDVEEIVGDVLDPASLRRAMAGCSTVFHSVVDPRFWLTDQTPIRRNNIDGLVHAMDAALEAGVGRFVFTSTMGTLGLNPDGPVTEEIPFNWADRASGYILARVDAEREFMRYCREKGLPGIALCVANTYGPQDYQPTPHNGTLWKVANGEMKVALDVGQPTVDIRDVAEAALLAEHNGRTGERYIIANEYVRAKEFYGMATGARGQPGPKLIPYRVGYAIAWIIERLFKLTGRRDFLVSTDAVFMSDAFRAMDNGKARRELGWSPRPLSQTVADSVAWFAAHNEGKA